MPYQLDRSSPNHVSARYTGYVRVGSTTYHMHWQPEIGCLYATGAAQKITQTLTAYPTHQILEAIQQATPQEEVVILPSVLPFWERYRPDEVEALAQVSYLTAEPPRGQKPRIRKVSPSIPPTPEGSLAHRIKMLSNFIDDLEKKGIKWRDIKQARNTLAKLETLLASLLEESQNPR